MDGEQVQYSEHFQSKENQRQNHHENCQNLAETQAHFAGVESAEGQAQDVQRGKAENQYPQYVVHIVFGFSEKIRKLKISKQRQTCRARAQKLCRAGARNDGSECGARRQTHAVCSTYTVLPNRTILSCLREDVRLVSLAFLDSPDVLDRRFPVGNFSARTREILRSTSRARRSLGKERLRRAASFSTWRAKVLSVETELLFQSEGERLEIDSLYLCDPLVSPLYEVSSSECAGADDLSRGKRFIGKSL